MRRLVVGCGYLGERVARLWRDAGDEVYATTRGDRVHALSLAGLRPLTVDVTKGPALGALPVVDTVVFAVGRDRRFGATMFNVHVGGFQAVLDALPASTGRVIYISSTGVYAQDAGEWVDEESACEPTREAGRACLSGERVLQTLRALWWRLRPRSRSSAGRTSCQTVIPPRAGSMWGCWQRGWEWPRRRSRTGVASASA